MELGWIKNNNTPVAQISTMILSERLSNIETEYAQRLTALEAKMDLILADRVNSNKALDMVTDVMKLIIEIQKQNNQPKNTLLIPQNQKLSDIVDPSDIITTLNQTIMSQEQNLTTLVADCKTDTMDLYSKLNIINTTLQNYTPNELGKDAFSASLSHDFTTSQGDAKVVFDKIITNIGHGYSANTGVYTVPHNGLYVFHWTILTRPGTSFDTELVVNGVPKRRNAADTGGGKSWNSGSIMIIILLHRNDLVWIRSRAAPYSSIPGSNWQGFSGYSLA